MKKRITDIFNAEIFFALIIFAVCILMCVRNISCCRSIIEKAAVISVKTVFVSAAENKKEEDEADIEKTAEEEIAAEKESEKKENVQEKETQQAIKSDSTLPDDNDFTAEPEDLKKLTREYAEKSANDKKDGAIKELTYTNSGVTDSYMNVKVKNVNDTGINIKKLLGEKPDITVKDRSKPSVLIFHTHTTESYQILDRSFYARGYVARSQSSSRNMIRVGDAVCQELEKAGFNVIHDKQIYDKVYNGAYNRSRVQVQEYLKKYPSIQIVLDIHRDAIEYNDGTKVKPVNEIKGKKCAQMMIISGCQEAGNGITDFEDWRYNLVFAVHLQKELEDMFPGITRPVYFCPRRYIMNESHCNLLVEVGSDANTLSEGVYAGKCLGAALSSLLEKYST